jgi:hypothetical protein
MKEGIIEGPTNWHDGSEISMVGWNMFSFISMRLQEIQGNNNYR